MSPLADPRYAAHVLGLDAAGLTASNPRFAAYLQRCARYPNAASMFCFLKIAAGQWHVQCAHLVPWNHGPNACCFVASVSTAYKH